MDERDTHSRNPEGPPGFRPAGRDGPRDWTRTVALAVVLAVFWFLLSGRWGLQYVLFMVTAVAVVLLLNPERPFGWRPDDTAKSRGMGLAARIRAVRHIVRYLAWLIWNVIKANIEVAVLILHPRLPIRPRLLTFRTTLRHPVAQVLVANSITLTPGTVTIELADGEYLVHALVPGSSGAITEAALQNMVAPIFGEPPDPVPEVRWYSSYRDVGR